MRDTDDMAFRRLLAMGSMNAAAFNSPKQINEMRREIRAKVQAQVEERTNIPQSTRLVHLFQRIGAEVKIGA